MTVDLRWFVDPETGEKKLQYTNKITIDGEPWHTVPEFKPEPKRKAREFNIVTHGNRIQCDAYPVGHPVSALEYGDKLIKVREVMPEDE